MAKTHKRDAREFARLLASDPIFQSKLKKRCMDELDGVYGHQLPAVEMIVSLATEAEAAPAGEFRVTFVARILGGVDALAPPIEVRALPEVSGEPPPIEVEALPAVDAVVVAGPPSS